MTFSPKCYCYSIYIISIFSLAIANWVYINKAFDQASSVKWQSPELKELSDADLTKSCITAGITGFCHDRSRTIKKEKDCWGTWYNFTIDANGERIYSKEKIPRVWEAPLDKYDNVTIT